MTCITYVNTIAICRQQQQIQANFIKSLTIAEYRLAEICREMTFAEVWYTHASRLSREEAADTLLDVKVWMQEF